MRKNLDTIFLRKNLDTICEKNLDTINLSEKYIDQDHYVDNHYFYIKIVEIIELPDKDVLVGYKILCDWSELDEEEYSKLPIHYRKLTQIELSYFPEDMKEENW